MSEPKALPEPSPTQPTSTRTGPGRLLVAIYGLFALAASSRAAVQIATKFHHAPVAYVLSAFAGVVYIIATVTLTAGSPTARRIAVVSCSVELVGVLHVLEPPGRPESLRHPPSLRPGESPAPIQPRPCRP